MKSIRIRMQGLSALILLLCLMQCRGLLTRQDQVDKSKIHSLHSMERQAIEERDYETLQSLWMDDGVMLPPGEAPVRGSAAVRAWNQSHKPDTSKVELVQFSQNIQECRRFGSWAFEWGVYESTVRVIETGDTLQSGGKIMRILQEDSDGSWKIARSMWNADRPD